MGIRAQRSCPSEAVGRSCEGSRSFVEGRDGRLRGWCTCRRRVDSGERDRLVAHAARAQRPGLDGAPHSSRDRHLPSRTARWAMRHKIDIAGAIGKRFGSWTVIARAGRRMYPGGKGAAMLLVRCDCGLEAQRQVHAILGGMSRSCVSCRKANTRDARRKRSNTDSLPPAHDTVVVAKEVCDCRWHNGILRTVCSTHGGAS